MRAVDYITNGFGAPTSGVIPNLMRSVERDRRILEVIQAFGLPRMVADAILATNRQFGPAGFARTAAFQSAIRDGESALFRMFPSTLSQLSGSMAGATFKRAVNSVINTAASRAGLTPLSSLMANAYRNASAMIPDSSPNPGNQFWALTPDWLQSAGIWVQKLSEIP